MKRVYISQWQQRKRRRLKNRTDLENGVITGATQMMRQRGITGRPHNYWKRKESTVKLSLDSDDSAEHSSTRISCD